MPDWATETPWWVVVGLTATLGFALFKAIRWTASTDNRLDTLEGLVKEIREDIKRIFDRLPKSAVESASPVQLTEFGKEISATAGAKAWAEKHAPNLVDEATGKPEFEVYEMCVWHFMQQLDDDPMLVRTIRSAAYDHGTNEDEVRKVYEVELRDRVLALRPHTEERRP